MNRKRERFSPSLTFTLPHAIKLTDRYVGCAPTDSLRVVSIYISWSSLSHPVLRKELNITGWPAVVLMWTVLFMFSLFSDGRISHAGSLLTVGLKLLVCVTKLPLIGNIHALWWLRWIVTLAGVLPLLSCLDKSIMLAHATFSQRLFCKEGCLAYFSYRFSTEASSLNKVVLIFSLSTHCKMLSRDVLMSPFKE